MKKSTQETVKKIKKAGKKVGEKAKEGNEMIKKNF
jgi:hypothetical protein